MAGAFFETVEHKKGCARIGRIGEGCARKADNIGGTDHTGHFQCDVDNLPLHRIGAGQRGTGRQLRGNDQIAPINLRNEAERRFTKFIHAEHNDGAISHKHHHRIAHDARGQPIIATGQGVKAQIKPMEKRGERMRPPFRIRAVVIVMFQQQGAERRRERE